MDWVTATLEVLIPRSVTQSDPKVTTQITDLLQPYSMAPTQPSSSSSSAAKMSLVKAPSHTYDELASKGGNPAALLGSLLANAPSLARVPSRGAPSPTKAVPAAVWMSPKKTPRQQLLPAAEALLPPLPARSQHEQQQQHLAIDVSPTHVQTATATYEVSGMSCGSCVAALESGLVKQPGVITATASLLTANLTVTFDQNVTSAERVAEAAGDLGYPARLLRVEVEQPIGTAAAADSAAAAAGGKLETVVLSVGGMSCGSCVATIESAVREVSMMWFSWPLLCSPCPVTGVTEH